MYPKRLTVFLSESQEKNLIFQWKELHELKDCEELLLAFNPLVMGVVKKYKYYGISAEDLAQEAWLGLCTALCKFDLAKGVRFSSYAKCWVNAYCQDYVLRNWSIVRIGTTSTHKKLFFQLGYLKRSLEKIDSEYLEQQTATSIAQELQSTVREVQAMHDRLSQKDKCLDQKIHENTDVTFIDLLTDSSDSIESLLINNELQNFHMHAYESFHKFLNDRELDILLKRRIEEPPKTLQEISICYGITKERVRQIENTAIEKLKKSLNKNL